MPTPTTELEDRLALRELHDRYADAVFQRDAEAWGATWAEDAVWNLSGSDVSGRDVIIGAWKQAMSQFAFVAFYCQPGVFSITGDRAEGRVYTREILEPVAGGIMRIVGVYTDAYVKREGGWLFARRAYQILKEA